MKFRGESLVIPALVVLFAGALYLPRLGDAPFYVTPDEVFSALTAHSVASTGRDLNGRLMPVYFQLPESFETRMWYQPIVIYAMAASVKVLPFSEGSIRLPATLAAVLDVLLAYLVAKQLFRREAIAVAAAVLLALTPAHFADSRVAMDHHAFLPFILGWLLCLLKYVERDKPFLVFAAGLTLGVGMFTYIGAYVLMPAFALTTCAVLYHRKAPIGQYAALAAGFLIPASAGILFVAAHPGVIGDTLWRYQRDKPQTTGTAALAVGLLTRERIAHAANVYWSFWQPRLLFVNGPRSLWVAGQFVLPIAGLFVAGAIRTLRRPDAMLLVIVAGLLIAPIPASIVGEPEVVRRAAAVMPFGVLFAVAGLDYMWTAERASLRRIAFVGAWAAVIGIAAMYHDEIPHAQALVRASTVPLAVVGLATLLDPVGLLRVRTRDTALASVAVFASTYGAYVVANGAATAGIALASGIALAALLERQPESIARHQIVGVALLAFVTANFMYVYVDYAWLHRVGAIPATAVVLAARIVVACAAMALAVGAAWMSSRVEANAAFRGWWLAVLPPAWLVALQFAYFTVDYSTDFRWRAVQAAVVLASAVGLAALVRSGPSRRVQLGPIAVTAVLTVAAMHFTPFYRDYFAGFRARGTPLPVSARVAFDPVIERTLDRPAPAIYLGWPYALGDLYWQFYLVKHHREDLRSHTIPDLDFRPDRIRALPGGSVVIASVSRQIDTAIDDMVARGELRRRELLRDADGTPVFWILETVSRRADAPRG